MFQIIGIPYRRLLCASNQNNILTDFLNRGIYDLANRPLHKTISPAIDILKSSNLERYIFHKTGRDGALVKTFYDGLENEKMFQLPPEVSLAYHLVLLLYDKLKLPRVCFSYLE